MNTKLFTPRPRILALLAALVFLFAIALPGYAQDESNEPPAPAEGFPYELKLVDAAIEEGEDEARQQWAMSGFDPAEYGGDDSDCDLTELDNVKWTDEVGAPDEDCKIVFEWSLKDGDETLASGMMPLEPEEESVGQEAQWIRFTFEQTDGRVRFVGSMWRLPKGWNAHQLSIDLAADWQKKNPDEWSVVGLSPTDDYIMGLWQAAEAVSDGGDPAPAAPTVPPPPTGTPPAEEVVCDPFNSDTGQPLVSAEGEPCAYGTPTEAVTPAPQPIVPPYWANRPWLALLPALIGLLLAAWAGQKAYKAWTPPTGTSIRVSRAIFWTVVAALGAVVLVVSMIWFF